MKNNKGKISVENNVWNYKIRKIGIVDINPNFGISLQQKNNKIEKNFYCDNHYHGKNHEICDIDEIPITLLEKLILDDYSEFIIDSDYLQAFFQKNNRINKFKKIVGNKNKLFHNLFHLMKKY